MTKCFKLVDFRIPTFKELHCPYMYYLSMHEDGMLKYSGCKNNAAVSFFHDLWATEKSVSDVRSDTECS